MFHSFLGLLDQDGRVRKVSDPKVLITFFGYMYDSEWVSINMEVSKLGVPLLKWMISGYPLFRETSTSITPRSGNAQQRRIISWKAADLKPDKFGG